MAHLTYLLVVALVATSALALPAQTGGPAGEHQAGGPQPKDRHPTGGSHAGGAQPQDGHKAAGPQTGEPQSKDGPKAAGPQTGEPHTGAPQAGSAQPQDGHKAAGPQTGGPHAGAPQAGGAQPQDGHKAAGPQTGGPHTGAPQAGGAQPQDGHKAAGPQTGGPHAGAPQAGGAQPQDGHKAAGPQTGGPQAGAPQAGGAQSQDGPKAAGPQTGGPHTGAPQAGGAQPQDGHKAAGPQGGAPQPDNGLHASGPQAAGPQGLATKLGQLGAKVSSQAIKAIGVIIAENPVQIPPVARKAPLQNVAGILIGQAAVNKMSAALQPAFTKQWQNLFALTQKDFEDFEQKVRSRASGAAAKEVAELIAVLNVAMVEDNSRVRTWIKQQVQDTAALAKKYTDLIEKRLKATGQDAADEAPILALRKEFQDLTLKWQTDVLNLTVKTRSTFLKNIKEATASAKDAGLKQALKNSGKSLLWRLIDEQVRTMTLLTATQIPEFSSYSVQADKVLFQIAVAAQANRL